MIVDSFPDRKIKIKGKEYLYFGGTSYLGIATHPEFQHNLARSLKKWGTFYGSSRNANVQLSVYNEFEQLFANQVGSEASLTTSSGTLAGKLVVDYLSKSISSFYHYTKTHPAILVKDSLPLFINGKLHPKLLDGTNEEIVITADAVLSLEVTATSFSFLNDISSRKKITLVIDESHSLGLMGEHGEGIFANISNEKLHRKVMISSLGKALGLSGGIIAGDKTFINTIKNESIFISSSSANPAYLNAFILSQGLFKAQRKKLKENLEFLFEDIEIAEIFKYNKSYPVIYSSNDNVFNCLLKKGIVITNFKYPTYKVAMNRIVITANHTQEDLKKIKNFLKPTILEAEL
ncbi:MAG: aminotransferase class I/II-fold pyridoxal phosphate-dependent enzyme [Flavobacteriaceae bacterium]|nr:aminotransferase class I/II-fold pyridoxal phosphate-dependent enzyme [Flavobacteriaceae bacterium]